ncbi:MAG: ABC transporter ATP-binding protein [Planctomycetota bacterium]
MNSAPAVEVRDLQKSYRLGKSRLQVLRGLDFSVRQGEFVSIVGASGSGKSTLLHLIGLLDRPDTGQVLLEGTDTAKISRMKRNRYRCRHVGFVFQFYHLLPELNVLENVTIPAKVDASMAQWMHRRGQVRKTAKQLLDQMGLSERIKHKPNELSGGERQRVAIARALINKPKLLLADEPTGNLDSRTGQAIMDVLEDFHNQTGQTILMVTHDVELAARAHRTVHLTDGKMT